MSPRTRGGATVAVALAVLAATTACTATPAAPGGSPVVLPATPSIAPSSSPVVPPSSTPPSSSPTPSTFSPAPSASATASTAACSSLTRIPDGAARWRIADGAQEPLFLTTSAPWCFGVQTGEHVVALPDPLPGTGQHRLWGVATDSAAGVAIVLDDGDDAVVYRLRDGALQQLRARAGGPLTFPVGASGGTGHGVACNDRNGGILIEQATAERRSSGRVDVLWSSVSEVNDAGVAQLDAPEVRFAGLQVDDPRVARAATSSCSAAPRQVVVTHG